MTPNSSSHDDFRHNGLALLELKHLDWGPKCSSKITWSLDDAACGSDKQLITASE
eukprot:CAMPEP_0203654402 /NCGR_PEP_ID=MMETSP0088-20131115/35079_1 /ASSEMBLY_ACC=CAM_ASM_001087 /TAXON_ID=426623 /ORGANISM="Chaetoceros affinis, Strain CCMP159" /LENGTH=54 /DNA_ID=CAMNT_0050514673 /DNA_START=280 /DNA_END=444 /DNA_ORIENTATION=-